MDGLNPTAAVRWPPAQRKIESSLEVDNRWINAHPDLLDFRVETVAGVPLACRGTGWE